jgi:putative colanic acid biosynthesis UDP-glucose lipid carrier transferase
MRLLGYNHRRIVLIGGEAVAQRVIRQLRENPWVGAEVVGLFEDRDIGTELDGIPVLGRFADAAPMLTARHDIHQVWFAMPLSAESRMRAVLTSLRHVTADICFVPDIFGFQLLNHSISEVAGLPIVFLTASPLVGTNRILKEIEDRVLATIVLVLLAPLMAAIAVAIKLTSRGPLLFVQKRHGWDGKSISVYKFRTMIVHDERPGNVTQATRNDPRVTRIGRILRRTSLDELPQLLNVLEGSMSLVGPRPHAVEHNEQYKELIDSYMLRHKVKPGITGWAQVNGYRGETDTVDKMKMRVEHDLYYIEHWSLWFDLRIMLLTLLRGVWWSNNAY